MTSSVWVFLQIVLIDVALAADNAVVIGLAAAGLSAQQRRWAILLGVGVAAALRVGMALIALRLLEIMGLTLAGGILLLWVGWRMAREWRAPAPRHHGRDVRVRPLSHAAAIIVLADVSMSLDNVLAVAGAANGHRLLLTGGLCLSVLLMGLAAHGIARLLNRFPWIAWIGLLMVFQVAVTMIWSGAHHVVRAW